MREETVRTEGVVPRFRVSLSPVWSGFESPVGMAFFNSKVGKEVAGRQPRTCRVRGRVEEVVWKAEMFLEEQVERVDIRSAAGETAEIPAERSHSGLILRAI